MSMYIYIHIYTYIYIYIYKYTFEHIYIPSWCLALVTYISSWCLALVVRMISHLSCPQHRNILEHTATHSLMASRFSCSLGLLPYTGLSCRYGLYFASIQVSLAQVQVSSAQSAVMVSRLSCSQHYNILQHTATHSRMVSRLAAFNTATHCNALQHAATRSHIISRTGHPQYCNTLQRTATHCQSVYLESDAFNTAKDCNKQSRTECNRLEQTATDCNRLEQTATQSLMVSQISYLQALSSCTPANGC